MECEVGVLCRHFCSCGDITAQNVSSGNVVSFGCCFLASNRVQGLLMAGLVLPIQFYRGRGRRGLHWSLELDVLSDDHHHHVRRRKKKQKKRKMTDRTLPLTFLRYFLVSFSLSLSLSLSMLSGIVVVLFDSSAYIFLRVSPGDYRHFG